MFVALLASNRMVVVQAISGPLAVSQHDGEGLGKWLHAEGLSSGMAFLHLPGDKINPLVSVVPSGSGHLKISP